MIYRDCDSYPQEFFFHDGNCDPACGLCCHSPCCCDGTSSSRDPSDGHCCKQQVVVSSSTGSAGPLAITGATGLTNPLNVVSTNINTCRLGTTDNLISFSCIVNIPSTVAAALTTLTFQVLRISCVGNAILIGSTYTFSVLTAALTSQSFNFSFTDNDVAPGTYTYSVQLASGSAVGVASTTVMNATLKVTATRS